MPPEYSQTQTPHASPPPTAIAEPPKSHGGGGFNFGMVFIILLCVAVLAFAGLSIYFYSQYNKEKTTVDAQVAAGADAAKAEQKAADEAEFAELAKQPYRSYTAPGTLGQLTVEFPKSWNVYAEEDQEKAVLNVFMNPEVVRAEKGYSGPYALRIKLEKKVYADALKTMDQKLKKGEVTASPVTVSGIAGTRFEGQIEDEHSGSMVFLPLRDKTLTIWTESPQFSEDFNNILQRLSVVP